MVCLTFSILRVVNWRIQHGMFCQGRALKIASGEEMVLVYDDHGQHQAASTVVELAKRGF